MIRPLLFLLVCAACASILFADEDKVDEPAAAFEAVTDFDKQQIDALLQRELERIKRLCEVTNDELDVLRKSVAPSVKAYLEQRAKERKDAEQNVVCVQRLSLPKPIGDAVLQSLERFVGKEKSLEFRQDCDDRQRFLHDVTIAALLNSLDANVVLSEQQAIALKRVLLENWNDLWTGGITNLMMDWGGSTFNQMPEQEVAKLLTARQKEVWTELRKRKNQGMVFIAAVEPVDEEKEQKQLEEFRMKCRRAVDLKVEALDRDYQLTQEQKKRLRIVGKGALEQTVVAWRGAHERWRETQLQLQANAGADQAFMPDMEAMMTISMPHGRLLDTKSEWSKFARSALNEQQREAFDERRQEWKQQAHRSNMGILTLGMNTEIGLTGQQMSDFQGLLLTNVSPSDTFAFDAYLDLADIPANAYRKILADDQWNRLEPQLTMMKQQIELMKQNRKQNED